LTLAHLRLILTKMKSKEEDSLLYGELFSAAGGTSEEREKAETDRFEQVADELSVLHETDVTGQMFDFETGEEIGRCWSDPKTAMAKVKTRHFSVPYREGQYEKIFGPKVGKA